MALIVIFYESNRDEKRRKDKSREHDMEDIDYIARASESISLIIQLIDNRLTESDIRNVIARALGYSGYSEAISVDTRRANDWKIMLADSFHQKLLKGLNEFHNINVCNGHSICMNAALTNSVILNVPISFKISELLRCEFGVDKLNPIKEVRVKSKKIIENIIIPLVEGTPFDEVNSLGEMYENINLDVIYNRMINVDAKAIKLDSESVTLFMEAFPRKDSVFSEGDYMMWSFTLKPFYDSELLFYFLSKDKFS